MKQYEMFFTNEYTEEILDELTKIFNTKYDKASLERAVNESDILSPNNVFRMNINDNRIVIDCNNKERIIYYLGYHVDINLWKKWQSQRPYR